MATSIGNNNNSVIHWIGEAGKQKKNKTHTHGQQAKEAQPSRENYFHGKTASRTLVT